MTHSTARLLSRSALRRLLRGLRIRLADGSQKIAEQLDQLKQELLATEQAADQTALSAQRQHQLDHTTVITEWDEQRMKVWDAAELRAFKAVTGAAAQEAQLRSDSRKQSDDLTNQAKSRIADIEKRFMRSKDKTIAKLNVLREKIEQLAGQLGVVQHEMATFLAQRGLSAQVAEVKLETPPGTSLEAMKRCSETIVAIRQHVARLANNRISKTIESVWFWLLCGATGAVITAILGASGLLPWLFAALAGVITAIIQGVIALVAVHPWIRRMIRAELPQLESMLGEGHQLQRMAIQLALQENDNELKRLAKKRDDRMLATVQWRDEALKELNAHVKQEMHRLRTFAATERRETKQQLDQGLVTVDHAGAARLSETVAQFAADEAQRASQLEFDKQRFAQAIARTEQHATQRIRTATQHAIQWMTRGEHWNQTHFPRWDMLTSDAAWHHSLTQPMLPLGSIAIDPILPEAIRLDTGGAVTAPVNFEPFRDQYLTITADPSHCASRQMIQSLILRALTTLPPGKVQVTVIDPPGLGRDFGWLMHLGDDDPELVTHRVWTQSNHIARHLTNLALKAEDFIQQSLRNQYATIEEYNRDAGALAEPYRLVVWSAFPLALDDQCWKPLQSLLDTGARCGIVPIFLIDPTQAWDQVDRRDQLMRRGLHISLGKDGRSWSLHEPELSSIPIHPEPTADEHTTNLLIHQVRRRARLANRVEVPLAGIAPAREQWWQADSSEFLEIPIGQSGVGRLQSLKLGVGTAQHAIVAGKTGSGKSTLLHAIITSAAVKYSPDRLRLVLLDFKKGVEFQAYSQSELPHADIIGIESQREFGLSALEYVDQCLQHRGQMFRDAGVQDLQSWNMIHPQKQMPRMLIVIDEFQELFVEDDKLSSQVSLILDRIVRQGRSFGIHAVLSSQTLAGAYSLPRTTMGQMAVRIALQCDASDAQLIFADDNPAASRLNHPGQAVYNDSGGRIEGNQSMQIGWLSKNEMMQWLSALPARGYVNRDSSTNLLGRSVVFDGNRAATWNRSAVVRAVETARQELNPDACWCVVGESVAISPAVTLPLTDQAGRNMLLVGSEEAQAASVILSIAGSFVAHHSPKHLPQLSIISAAKPTDAKCLSLPERIRQLPAQVQVADVRGADGLLGEIHATLKTRMESPEGYQQWQPILLAIINIGRLRTFRPEDEYGMGSFGDSRVTPDKQLEEILREGPGHHIHVLIHGENATTVNRWLTRSSQRELEIRLLMQMSANDSTHLIDSVAASHLGAHVMLLHDDATSTQARFRPYEIDSLVGLAELTSLPTA